VPLRKSSVGVGLGGVVTVHPRVHATTVNRTDCGLWAAKPFIVRFFTGLSRPRVTVLGNEFAGEIEAVGHGVTSFRVGDRVIDYMAEDFTEDEQSYHVVLDAVGKRSFGRYKRLLKPGGISRRT
jgi:NADPH:quinone reductase-like Zn-dependent oxidoreductase